MTRRPSGISDFTASSAPSASEPRAIQMAPPIQIMTSWRPPANSPLIILLPNNGNTPAEIGNLGGASGLHIQSTGFTPTTLLFYEIQPSSANPKPASTLVGSFTLGGDGSLTFQSGPMLDAAQITSVAVNGGTASVTFNTRAAVKHAAALQRSIAERPCNLVDPSGRGCGRWNPANLAGYNSATDAARYYTVESYQ